MAAKIIVICNQKGGPGKTTVTLNLSGELGSRGNKVLGVDGDPQSSLVEIAALAPEGERLPANIVSLWKAGRKIHQEIKGFIDLYDYIIVDCPPAADSPIAQSALLIADLAIVPFVPAVIDSLAATRIRDAIEVAQENNPDLVGCILLNRVEENKSITHEIIADLENEFKMPILKTRLTSRAAYVESPALGNSIHAIKARKEKIEPVLREIKNLGDEVIKILHKDNITFYAQGASA